MFAIIQAAGWPIWPLLLASILAVAFIIERSIALRRSKVVPEGLLQSIVSEYRQAGATEEMIARLSKHSPLGRVLSAGLRNVKSSREAMKEAIEEAGRGVTHELERFLTSLGTIASIAPLMGLFGTVVGMIQVFREFVSAYAAGTVGPDSFAQGIWQALITTAYGLTVAIPTLLLYRYLQGRNNSLVLEMEEDAMGIVNLLEDGRRAARESRV